MASMSVTLYANAKPLIAAIHVLNAAAPLIGGRRALAAAKVLAPWLVWFRMGDHGRWRPMGRHSAAVVWPDDDGWTVEVSRDDEVDVED